MKNSDCQTVSRPIFYSLTSSKVKGTFSYNYYILKYIEQSVTLVFLNFKKIFLVLFFGNKYGIYSKICICKYSICIYKHIYSIYI